MKFIILHGSFGGPERNWFPYLKKQLEILGQEVIVPQFPVDDYQELTKAGEKKARAKNQSLENWLDTFRKEVLPEVKKEKDPVIIGHSIGTVFTLHLVDRFNLKLNSAIFVAPFLDKLNKHWQIDLVNSSFYKTDFDFAKLKKLIPFSYSIHSDNDPYVDTKYSLDFIKQMESSRIAVKGGMHFNAEAKFFSFPLVFELCKSRLDTKEYL